MANQYQGGPYGDYAQQGYQQPSRQQANPYSRQQANPYSRQQQDGFVRHQQAYQQPDYQAPSKKGGILPVVLGVVAGLLVGALAMFFALKFVPVGGGSAIQQAPATLSDAQLSLVVGQYTFDGQTYDVTAREAILGTQKLSASQNADGSYDTPSADMVLSFARNQILAKLVAASGITVTPDEVGTYTYGLFGTYDVAVAAQYLNMDAGQAQEALTAACAVSKLKTVVCGSATTLAPPTYPADGQTEIGREEYANYILGLLGSNWDWSLMSWSNTDNPYYQALKDSVFAQGSASYEAAMIAYGVAVQQSGAAGTNASQIWTDYVNEYLDKGAIVVYTLRA